MTSSLHADLTTLIQLLQQLADTMRRQRKRKASDQPSPSPICVNPRWRKGPCEIHALVRDNRGYAERESIDPERRDNREATDKALSIVWPDCTCEFSRDGRIWMGACRFVTKFSG